MPANFARFEYSAQQVPPSALDTRPVASSAPLHDLVDLAPARHPSPGVWRKNPEYIPYAFSNDECTAPYFQRLMARTQTSDYRTATNRVAILVGESGLAANLAFIPEETIIMLDDSEAMCTFMQRYINSLRSARDVTAWKSMMLRRTTESDKSLFERQVKIWRLQGLVHPLADDEAFHEAAEIANEKAIIPWRADIREPDQIEQLGNALRAQDAHVTFMNLTNVVMYNDNYKRSRNAARVFGQLPVTKFAPILTSSIYARRPYADWKISLDESEKGLGITGPFFGLANLAEHGGSMASAGCTIIKRQLMSEHVVQAPHPVPGTVSREFDRVV